MWKNKFPSHKQYILGLFFSRNVSRAHADQSILQNILLCLKRNISQTFKSSSCKKVFLKCVYHWYNLLRWMFFITCNNWKTLFFTQIYRYSEVSYNHHVAAFFEKSNLKEVGILYPVSPQKHYNAADTKGPK